MEYFLCIIGILLFGIFSGILLVDKIKNKVAWSSGHIIIFLLFLYAFIENIIIGLCIM